MPEYRIMILELHGREITVDADDTEGAIKAVAKKLVEKDVQLPESIPLQVLSPLIWPITETSKLIKPNTTIITPNSIN